jgi:hypothetical protein
MKKKIIIVAMILVTGTAYGQSWNEWFRQKRTQIRYLGEQIAQLQAQIMLLKEGYDAAKEGWEFIHDMTNGEFDLHKDYFSHQDNINPIIDEDPEKTKREIEELIRKSK